MFFQLLATYVAQFIGLFEVTSSHAVAGSFSVTFRGTSIREPVTALGLHTNSTFGLATKTKLLMTPSGNLIEFRV